jgi:fumarate hydratase subunit alpha
MARELHVDEIRDAVAKLAEEAAFDLPEDFLGALRRMQQAEESELGKHVIGQLIKNAELARDDRLPMCQDTGMAIIFMDIGQDVRLSGGDLRTAVDEGVRRAYKEHYLRKSIYQNPYKRDKNTGDNTPAIIHYDIVPGDKVKILFAAKGGGSENMSTVKMMRPADGLAGVKKFVTDWVTQAGGNPCPPIVVGVCIGGNFELSALLAKKAVMRPVDDRHPDAEIAALEDELLELVNKTGVGPGGFGGTQTAAAVKVEVRPCHIATFPVAIAIQCNASRHKEIVL